MSSEKEEKSARTISVGPKDQRIGGAKACRCDCRHCKTLKFVILRSDAREELWDLLGHEFERDEDGKWRIKGVASIAIQHKPKSDTYCLIFIPYSVEIEYDPATQTGSVLSAEQIQVDLD